uniref:Ig-like domain-containing protein n=1 Tax=Dicentrarchus labrax TaxID=13489 RepID=A0A8C4GFQ9_DICLA
MRGLHDFIIHAFPLQKCLIYLSRKLKYVAFTSLKNAPRVPSVSVSPSGEIVEGSSVNLTCSSDANPAANYTWYKENQTLFQGTEGIHHFTSISSEDRGIYHCSSENQYGQIMSPPLSVDVQCKCNTRTNLHSVPGLCVSVFGTEQLLTIFMEEQVALYTT